MQNKLAPKNKGRNKVLILALGSLGLLLTAPQWARAASFPFTPPTPTPTSTGTQTTPTATTPPPIIILPPPPVNRPPIVVPTDVTSPQLVNPNLEPGNAPEAMALNGVEVLDSQDFPTTDMLTGNSDWITVLAKDGAQFSKPNNFTVDLKEGDIIVSVKQPSKLAFVTTAYGSIAIGANADCMICFNNGVLRILNFDGSGRTIKAELNKGPFASPEADPTVAIACGYELIASSDKIGRNQLRPGDGIARRHAKVLENGNLAISEFSLESAMKSCDLLVELEQKANGIKERRMLSDMAKMAAVLNYKVGTQGFSPER